jgi:hypothetical protein
MEKFDLVKAKKIACLNDEHRKTSQGFLLTRGVSALPDVTEVINKVRDFNEFGEDNDPYDEHDFGSFDCFGKKLFWKIDYYDEELDL